MNVRFFKLTFASTLAVLSTCAWGESFELVNDKIKFQVDERGNLTSLKNLVDNREYAGGEGLWRIIYQDGLSLEESIESESVPVKVEKRDGKIFLSYGGDFPVNIECRLEGDEVRFVPEIKNASKDKILREFQFPMVKSAQLKPESDFLWSFVGGQRFTDIRRWLNSGFRSYMAQDNKAIEQYELYPGQVAMNWYVVSEPKCSLYIACLDPQFEKTLHLARMRKTGGRGEFSYGGVDFAMSKYPFLKSGESKKFAQYVLSPHSGDWHISAKKYRKWADTWYKHVPIDPDFKKSNGWQRIILRHQYGKVLFRYDQLPEIRKAGKAAGIDTVLLFGWWKEGMDAGYPEYSPDDTQGGDAALKKWIREFQKDGGKVNLYYNGQLIDMSTKFYRTLGKKISIKRADGTEHMERYPFGGDGTALRVFGNKTFVTACPATNEWLEILKGLIDRAIDLGANGVFFDQLGFKSELCYDVSHGHQIPCQNIMHYKHELLKALRAYIDKKKPDMSFGTEWLSDPTSMFVDYVHNCGVSLHIVGKDRNGVPITRYAPLYQYTFPEVYTTNRDIYNNNDVIRRCNLSALRGWRDDAAVYRCRATVDDAPVYRDYLAKENALRDSFRDTILNGVFKDTDLASCDNPQLQYRTFLSQDGKKMSIVCTQSHLATVNAKFDVGSWKYLRHAGLGDFSYSLSGVQLSRDALLVIEYGRE